MLRGASAGRTSSLLLLLSAGAGVGTSLSLVVGVSLDNTSLVLLSLLSTTDNSLLDALLLLNLRSLLSDLTITGHGTVDLSYIQQGNWLDDGKLEDSACHEKEWQLV